jgi:hypothetical protein
MLVEGGFAWSHLDHLALRAALAGKLDDAARVVGFADAAFEARKITRQPNEARSRERLQRLLRERLSPDAVARLCAEGAALTQESAVSRALDG